MNQYKTNPFNTFDKNAPAIRTAIAINAKFWITLLCACIILALLRRDINTPFINHIIIAIISVIIAAVTGWLAHLVSHSFDFAQAFKHIRTRSPTLNMLCHIKPIEIIIQNICYQLDFHHKIHHDTTINRKPIYILTEFIQNVITQGLGIALLLAWIGVSFGKTAATFNYAAMTMYGLLYATVHNINYILSPSICHEEHHRDELTNFGIDFLDIIFNTKFDTKNVESVNHYAPNIAIICLLIYIIHRYVNPTSPIATFFFGKPHNFLFLENHNNIKHSI